ncbi:DNA-directed RNA polymerase subunit P [Candidatus Woesearchaeota archaeon]|nr:DNA-directed RNA polymerase subunit P [Candidatus Woesearchaeota archaeon]
MVEYKCFNCNKKIDRNLLRRRIRCPYCGSKLLFKSRSIPHKIKAR